MLMWPTLLYHAKTADPELRCLACLMYVVLLLALCPMWLRAACRRWMGLLLRKAA